MDETRNASKLATPSRSAAKAEVASESKLVHAKMHQGYETKINIRLVPGRGIDITSKPTGCQPRLGAPRRNAEPLSLPPAVISKLQDADKVVVAWLAKDEANARLFIANPAEALVAAGVDLTRAEQKAIGRAHNEVAETMVVGPGVKVNKIDVAAFRRGQVGKIKPGAKPQDDSDDNIGCVKE